MQLSLILTEPMHPTLQLSHLSNALNSNIDDRANCVSVTLHSLQVEFYPVIRIPHISKELRGSVIERSGPVPICDKQVYEPVVIKIYR